MGTSLVVTPGRAPGFGFGCCRCWGLKSWGSKGHAAPFFTVQRWRGVRLTCGTRRHLGVAPASWTVTDLRNGGCFGASFRSRWVTDSRLRRGAGNRSHYSVYVIAYDPTCRIRVFEGLLAEGSSITVRVCAGYRRLGSIVVYDVNGRNLKFSKLHDGSQVSVRFRNLSNR